MFFSPKRNWTSPILWRFKTRLSVGCFPNPDSVYIVTHSYISNLIQLSWAQDCLVDWLNRKMRCPLCRMDLQSAYHNQAGGIQKHGSSCWTVKQKRTWRKIYCNSVLEGLSGKSQQEAISLRLIQHCTIETTDWKSGLGLDVLTNPSIAPNSSAVHKPIQWARLVAIFYQKG